MFEGLFQQTRRQTIWLDMVVTTLALLGAYWVRENTMMPGASLLPYLALLAVIGPLWVFLLTGFGAYAAPGTSTISERSWAVLRAVATGLALILTLLFALKVQYVSRVIVFTFAALNFLGLVGVRIAMDFSFRRSLERGASLRKVLIVGSGNRARRLASMLLRKADRGIHIVGYLDPDPTVVGRRLVGATVLGTVDDITALLKENVVDEVILATPRGMIGVVEKVVRACEDEGVMVRLMADLFDVSVARMSLDSFDGVPLLTLEPVALDEWKLLVKQSLDLCLSLLVLPMILPVMALIALLIKLDSTGPVFFLQDRVGLNKRKFRIYKFRTMREGSEGLQASLESMNEADGPVFKIVNDPRVTRVGHFLRKTSLDELPQIFNVIRGEMSLVGPRPLPVRDVDLFDQGIQRKRFSVKPGITGLWQISGRSSLPFVKWMELDLGYIENWTVTLDLKILLKTIPVVVRRVGAA